MGMSSSQARLLTLTARMHDIEYKAQRLEAQKLQMANESRRAYESYLEALDATKIQYKSINGDGSITFRDATLRTLENGAIPGYEGEASHKPFLLKNGMTDEIYVTPEFAAAFGITDNSDLPPVGTLEQWLEEYPGLSRTGYYVENRVTSPGDLKTVYINDISGAVTKPEMIKHIYTGIPELGTIPTSQRYGWKMSSLNGGNLPTDWKNANGYGYYNLSDGPYSIAKVNNGIVRVGNCNHTGPQGGTLTYDFELSNQYNAYSFGFLKGLATGYVDYEASFATLISNVPVDENGHGTYAERYMIGSGHYTGIYAYDGTEDSKTKAKTMSTFLYHAMQIMSSILDEYGTECATNPASKEVVDDFYYNVMSKLETRQATDDPIDLYNALIQFCKTHTKKNGGAYASITNDKFDIEKSSCFCVCESNGSTSAAARSKVFESEGNPKTYGVVSDYSKNDIKTLIKLGLVDAGMTEDDANTKVNSLTDWQLYSIITKYNSTDWTTCINSIINGTFSAGSKPTRFELAANQTDSITLAETEFVTNLADADTLNFDYTIGSYQQQVLYDICQTDNEIDKDTYSGFIESLTQEELASLIDLKFNNPTAYQNIINQIKDADTPEKKAAVKAQLTSCAGKTITWGTNTVQFNQTPERVGKGKLEIPTLAGIASNIYIAMKQNNIDGITEGEILNYLQTNYGTDNYNNNLVLGYINEKACEGDISVLTDVAEGRVRTIMDIGDYRGRYPVTDYDITRNIPGRAQEDWVHNDIYEQAVREYNMRKAMEDTKFRIIRDEDLLNSSEFVSNWLTLNEGYLLEFDPETFGMTDTNVAVTTSLQEVSDERNLKKAEAQYEADMRRIDQKDRRYDTQLAALDTERNAIKLEMETVKTVAKDNVDRTFRLFS